MTPAPWQGATVRRPVASDADPTGRVQVLVNGTWRRMAIRKATASSLPWRHTPGWLKRQTQ
jgi:hypothetical protein